ncbi:hypothetical protein MMC16_006900 [Acarospora aff. strigata]|nr:hypothetical protein [Acarospora aff. strigata]
MSEHGSKDPEMYGRDNSIATTPYHPTSSHFVDEPVEKALEPMAGHLMSPQDPDNPLNWSISRKVYASAVATAFAFVVAFGATVYTVGIPEVTMRFNVSTTAAILGLSLYLFGIAFAPITTPHLTERLGRSTVYMISLPLFSLFILGAGLSRNFASLAICRFFAGFFGGPCLVLIEGTFADVWSADYTITYYAMLSLASYVGAAAGPVIGGFVVAAKGWRWSQWVALMLALAAYLLGIGIPETYPRSIVARRAKRLGVPHNLVAAPSGVTITDMLRVTLFTPLKMLVSEPIVVMISLYLGFNFAVIFSFFITIPVVLGTVYSFTTQQAGLAFTAAIAGSLLAAVTSIIIDRLTHPKLLKKSHDGTVDVEFRLYPAMIGCFGIMASLFWVAWTASPTVKWPSPVIGTLLYVWGNLSVLISLVSYLFDAYPPRGTLSALTAAASLRLVLAAALPLVIVQNLTGAWALSLFGFIAAALIPVPFVLFKWGKSFRNKSRYGQGTGTMGSVAGEGERMT